MSRSHTTAAHFLIALLPRWLLRPSARCLRPLTPDHVPWSDHYPAYLGAGNVPTELAGPAGADGARSALAEVRVADVGCGFGGMSVALSEIFPDKLVLGLEIRDRVVDIVKDRIAKLRKEAAAAAAAASSSSSSSAVAAPADAAGAEGAAAAAAAFHPTNSASPSPAPWMPHAPSYAAGRPAFTYQNVSCVKVNFMKYAPNYFRQGQLDAIFFLFADPHFKKANHRRRVINENFLAIYAYILRVGGMLYTITDVEDLHKWEVAALDAHPLFRRIPDADLATDPCFLAMHSATEEGQKVTRLSGSKFPAVYRRVEAPENDDDE